MVVRDLGATLQQGSINRTKSIVLTVQLFWSRNFSQVVPLSYPVAPMASISMVIGETALVAREEKKSTQQHYKYLLE